jgi:hypothetical protein
MQSEKYYIAHNCIRLYKKDENNRWLTTSPFRTSQCNGPRRWWLSYMPRKIEHATAVFTNARAWYVAVDMDCLAVFPKLIYEKDFERAKELKITLYPTLTLCQKACCR